MGSIHDKKILPENTKRSFIERVCAESCMLNEIETNFSATRRNWIFETEVFYFFHLS